MKKLFYLLIPFLFIGIHLHSQSIYTSCDLAEMNQIECNFDNLHGFMGTMFEEDSPGMQPVPMCPSGGSAHNIGWLAFVAQQGFYTINISFNDCSNDVPNQDPGVQFGIYEDCSFTQSIICNPDCSTNDISISSTELTPGQSYYLFIDGCFGTICDFEITIDGIVDIVTMVDTTICEGQDYNGLTDSGTYNITIVDEVTGCETQETVNLVVLPISHPSCITNAKELENPNVTLYPNPAQSLFFIESDQPLDKVSMFSTSAQKVVQTSIPQGQLKYGISIDDLPKGLYIVQIETKGQTIFKKMVIE